jgi:hypothetical protein
MFTNQLENSSSFVQSYKLSLIQGKGLMSILFGPSLNYGWMQMLLVLHRGYYFWDMAKVFGLNWESWIF